MTSAYVVGYQYQNTFFTSFFFLELLLGNRENFLYRACNQRLMGKFSSVSRVIGHYPNPRNDHCCDQFVYIYIYIFIGCLS